MALEHGAVDTLIITLVALEGLVAVVVALVVLEVMLVLGYEGARVAREQLLRRYVSLDVLPFINPFGGFMVTKLAPVQLSLRHLDAGKWSSEFGCVCVRACVLVRVCVCAADCGDLEALTFSRAQIADWKND